MLARMIEFRVEFGVNVLLDCAMPCSAQTELAFMFAPPLVSRGCENVKEKERGLCAIVSYTDK